MQRQRRLQLIGFLFAVGMIVATFIFGHFDKPDDTANTIIAAKRACEAQTGEPCSIP